MSHAVDLTSCDREPLEWSGQIQNQGVLLVFDETMRLSHYSTNVGDHFQIGDRPAGAVLQDFFEDDVEHFQRRARRLSRQDATVIRGVVTNTGVEGDLWRSARDGAVYLEFEPSRESPRPPRREIRVQSSSPWPDLEIGEVVEEVARISGFPKVMMYRFLPDGSGEVIAEASDDTFEPYFGLRFPASDVPSIARALYLANPFRVIFDVDGETVPVVPAGDRWDASVSLATTVLRSVSPVHLEYLRNMGVGSSASFPVVVLGKLWGLMALHHDQPFVLPVQDRVDITRVVDDRVSRVVMNSQVNASNAAFNRSAHLVDRMVASLVGLVDSDVYEPPEGIQDLMGASGMIVLRHGRPVCNHSVLDGDDVERLVSLGREKSNGVHYHTAAVGDHIVQDDAFRRAASGMLYLPFRGRRSTPDAPPLVEVVFLRGETLESVDWAGNPEKPAVLVDGEMRLSPRTSFEKYTAMAHGRSTPWSNTDLMFLGKIIQPTVSGVNQRTG